MRYNVVCFYQRALIARRLITIMFTKLRMSVEEATKEFYTIFEAVYKPLELKPFERSVKLRACMEDLLQRRNLPTDSKLVERASEGECAG